MAGAIGGCHRVPKSHPPLALRARSLTRAILGARPLGRLTPFTADPVGRSRSALPAEGGRQAAKRHAPPLRNEGGVDSTLKCNGIEVEEYFVGGEVAETFARPLIEQVLDGLKF